MERTSEVGVRMEGKKKKMSIGDRLKLAAIESDEVGQLSSSMGIIEIFGNVVRGEVNAEKKTKTMSNPPVYENTYPLAF
jgi:hypothetical protein